jgi:polynucleotide 5'-kinase involved in rRNA processing
MASVGDYGLGERELGRLERSSVRLIYVMGDTGTGKTTLAASLADRLAACGPTARLDLDGGQASVGPPTTFAWRLCGKRRRKPDGMYFTGTTSPTGHFDICVAGAARLAAEARARAETVVVDTCGLVRGDAGRRLHHAVLDAVGADAIVAIEREGELAGVLGPLGGLGRGLIVRASVPGQARRRSWAARRSYRRRRFRDYFAQGREVELDLGRVGVFRPRRDPEGRIASLRDPAGRDVALGIVQAVRSRSGTMTVWSPVPRRTRVRAVVLGSMRIARDGRQLARDV